MFKKIAKFIEDVRTEMAKVTWPTQDELLNSTMIVAVVSIIFTLFIFFADFIVSRLMTLLL